MVSVYAAYLEYLTQMLRSISRHKPFAAGSEDEQHKAWQRVQDDVFPDGPVKFDVHARFIRLAAVPAGYLFTLHNWDVEMRERLVELTQEYRRFVPAPELSCENETDQEVAGGAGETREQQVGHCDAEDDDRTGRSRTEVANEQSAQLLILDAGMGNGDGAAQPLNTDLESTGTEVDDTIDNAGDRRDAKRCRTTTKTHGANANASSTMVTRSKRKHAASIVDTSGNLDQDKPTKPSCLTNHQQVVSLPKAPQKNADSTSSSSAPASEPTPKKPRRAGATRASHTHPQSAAKTSPRAKRMETSPQVDFAHDELLLQGLTEWTPHSYPKPQIAWSLVLKMVKDQGYPQAARWTDLRVRFNQLLELLAARDLPAAHEPLKCMLRAYCKSQERRTRAMVAFLFAVDDKMTHPPNRNAHTTLRTASVAHATTATGSQSKRASVERSQEPQQVVATSRQDETAPTVPASETCSEPCKLAKLQYLPMVLDTFREHQAQINKDLVMFVDYAKKLREGNSLQDVLAFFHDE